MVALITGKGRKPADNDPDRAALFRTMLAYSGVYHVDAEKFSTKVDISWNEAWTGTDQVRFYKLEGAYGPGWRRSRNKEDFKQC